MSLHMITQVFNDRSIKVPAERLVMLALADCHNEKNGCYPSIKTLALKTQLTERGVQKAIRELIRTGKLRKIPGGGRGKKNIYQLSYPEKIKIQKPQAASQEPPIVILEMIPQIQKEYPELNVAALFLPAKEAFAKKYPDAGPMDRQFFEEYLDNELKKPRQGQDNIVPFATNGSAPSTPPMDKKTREQFIATVHAQCPQINVKDIAERLETELAGKPWDQKEFKRRVVQAQDAFAKSWTENRQ